MSTFKSLHYEDNSDGQFKMWIRKIQNIHISIDESKKELEKIKAMVEQIVDEIQVEQHNLTKIQCNVESAENECQSLKSTISKLTNERESLKFEIAAIQPKLIKSIESKKLLKDGHKKIRLYKYLTGIRWDFAKADQCIKGVLTNNKDYLENINFGLDTEDIINILWDKIYKSIKHTPMDKNKKILR